MKVAVVHDWLVTYAGAERVLEQILEIFPAADLFAVIDFFPAAERQRHLRGKVAKTTFIQNLPRARHHYQKYLPLMPLAIEQFDLKGYDLVISSSHAVAKGVITGPGQLHIAYVHSPMRYAWDMQGTYLKEAGLEHGVKGALAKLILHYMRLWDSRTAVGVDYFIANSHYIARRIHKVYGREAEVIYPPVAVDDFALGEDKRDFYLAASRLVPYKKIRLIAEAFREMPEKQLLIIGDGAEYDKIKALAQDNITLLGFQPTAVLREKMQQAKAFIFAAEEDFGIMPVEAQACGTPVIAFGRGGALETIRGADHEVPTGVFFPEPTKESIIAAVARFEGLSIRSQDCRDNALRFCTARFREEFQAMVARALSEQHGDMKFSKNDIV